MTKIFISYRREDSQWPAHRLYEAIKARLRNPESEVFIDVDNMPLGINFADYIDGKVAQCDVLLALIGPHWLTASDSKTGERRLDDAQDFVRIEIASALKRGIRVVPVLLDGAPVPAAGDLPDELRELAMRHGVEIRRQNFEVDTERLIEGLRAGANADAKSASAEPPRPKPAPPPKPRPAPPPKPAAMAGPGGKKPFPVAIIAGIAVALLIVLGGLGLWAMTLISSSGSPPGGPIAFAGAPAEGGADATGPQGGFGDNNHVYANDGECDDPRFYGSGAADFSSPDAEGHDAADCEAAWNAGTIVQVGVYANGPGGMPDFGDNSHFYANDGECDDARFSGPGAAAFTSADDTGHDAADCKAAWEAGTVSLAVPGAPDFGDDASQWAGDGECDDPRFQGSAMASFLVDEDRGHDATDCRNAWSAGLITLK